MDFWQFVDILAKGHLWFNRIDLSDDPREGLYTDVEFARLSGRSDGMAYSIEKSRSMSHANCWHESECESAAMWDLYGARGRGVAIKTTWISLKNAIATADFPIYCGRVRYIDVNKHDGGHENLIGMWVRKDQRYRHESEVRLLIWDAFLEEPHRPDEALRFGQAVNFERMLPDVLQTLAQHCPNADLKSLDGKSLILEAKMNYLERVRLENLRPGVSVSAKPSSFLREVVVGPRSKEWQVDLVKNVINDYKIDVNVRGSDLSAPTRSPHRFVRP